MLCSEFEDHLSDYLDGALGGDARHAFADHAAHCPVCHTLLAEVGDAVAQCRASVPPQPPADLEAQILRLTAPETAMSCKEFEEHLTDYLDGFLPASLYHRWERHAALCEPCSDLPGQVVRAIGACYSYISEERAVPAGLHERILRATLGTAEAALVRAPLGARLAERLRGWLDALVTPQLATVATMILLAVLVGTSTVSDDGSIGGMYRAGLRVAAQTYEHGANSAGGIRRVTEGLVNLPAQGEIKSGGGPQGADDEQKKDR